MELKGYKRTEIGVIPEKWKVKHLKDIFQLKNGYAFSSDYFSNTGPIVITPGNFNINGGLNFNEKNTLRYSGETTPGMQFSNGDLLIVMTDLTPECNLLGKPGFVTSNEIILHNQRIGKIILTDNEVDLHYLYWFFLSGHFSKRMKETATGSTVRHTSNKSIYNTLIAIPKKAEQEAIATALSDADALISSLEKLVTKKRLIKQGAAQQLLTGKKRLPGFSGEWNVKRMGDIANFFKGKGLPKSQLIENGKNACIHYGELFTTYNELIKRIISYTDKNSDVFLSKSNDVLMPTSDVTPKGLAKASCIKEDEVIIGGDILIIRTPADAINGVYLSNSITLNKNQILALVTGSTVYHLYASDMKKFEFYCPPTKEEQTAIVEILSDMDTEIETLEKKLAKYRLIKQGMMQQLLTGKIRLV